jgi:Protein of unknown function (DUF4058)
MPSPFLGMNPFLEVPELWSEFHSRMIVAIADALDTTLSREYRVAVEKRVYLAQDDDTILIGIPDVSVTIAPSASILQTAVLEAPMTVEIPLAEEVQERYLEIREVATGRVVTVIELLSPKNKRSGIGRDAYLQKRQQIMISQTHLVEIDLLRAGEALPIIGGVASHYRILISPSSIRSKAHLYAFNIRQPIPSVLGSAIAIPLHQTTTIALDLQPLLHQVYDRARFELAIDYHQSPSPKLSDEDNSWLSGFIESSSPPTKPPTPYPPPNSPADPTAQSPPP